LNTALENQSDSYEGIINFIPTAL